jgi:hypothetical protein
MLGNLPLKMASDATPNRAIRVRYAHCRDARICRMDGVQLCIFMHWPAWGKLRRDHQLRSSLYVMGAERESLATE